jgi:hypothetical protein
MLQSKGGIENKEYKVQRSILADVDDGKISKEELFRHGEQLLSERLHDCGVATEPERPNQPRAATPLVGIYKC